jgi:hypothetical protein
MGAILIWSLNYLVALIYLEMLLLTFEYNILVGCFLPAPGFLVIHTVSKNFWSLRNGH